MITLAIIGGRDFNDYPKMVEFISTYFSHFDYQLDTRIWHFDSIVSGGASGADKMSEVFAKEHNIPIKVYPANWALYKKSAGFIRNKEIIDAASVVLAFWTGESKGTQHSIGLAKQAKKTTIICYY